MIMAISEKAFDEGAEEVEHFDRTISLEAF
jgi:hypothetical protein